jgi:hypothetical protein
MREKINLALIVLGIFFTAQSINAQKIVKIELVLPKTTFDVKLAFDMLNTGTSEIKGKVLYEQRAGVIRRKVGDDQFARIGTVVSVFPITPYFAEFLELRKQDKKDKRMASISNEANSFRVLTKVYTQEGEFVVKGLKPGKYYLESFISYPSGVGGLDIYGIVEIKSDSESVTTILKDVYKQKQTQF